MTAPVLFFLTEQLINAWEALDAKQGTLAWARMERVLHHDDMRAKLGIPRVFALRPR